MFFAEKAGGKGDLPDNLNAAAPLYWKFGQHAFMISSVSQIYPTAVIWMFWAQDSFCVARRFWLPCHISKHFFALAILRILLPSASELISRAASVFVVSNATSSPAKVLPLGWENCLTMSLLRRVSPVVSDGLQRIISHHQENWPRPRRHVVWFRVSHVPHCGDLRTSSAFPLVDATSQWHAASKMYFWSA